MSGHEKYEGLALPIIRGWGEPIATVHAECLVKNRWARSGEHIPIFTSISCTTQLHIDTHDDELLAAEKAPAVNTTTTKEDRSRSGNSKDGEFSSNSKSNAAASVAGDIISAK